MKKLMIRSSIAFMILSLGLLMGCGKSDSPDNHPTPPAPNPPAASGAALMYGDKIIGDGQTLEVETKLKFKADESHEAMEAVEPIYVVAKAEGPYKFHAEPPAGTTQLWCLGGNCTTYKPGQDMTVNDVTLEKDETHPDLFSTDLQYEPIRPKGEVSKHKVAFAVTGPDGKTSTITVIFNMK